MTATKLMRDRHNQLLTLRNDLENEITNRKRKMQIPNTGNPDQWDDYEDQLIEIEQLQRELQRFIISFESTWEIQ